MTKRMEVDDRHTKVAEIIRRHLDAIKGEILAFDQQTLMIDSAGDRAEIALQVLTELVPQLRGFGRGARDDLREEEERAGGWGIGAAEAA